MLKIGSSPEHSSARARVSFMGQQLSPVGFNVRTMPLPVGSDLCFGIQINMVSVSSNSRMKLGVIQLNFSAFRELAGRKVPTLRMVV